MFAVVDIAGKQYRVAVGDVLSVNSMDGKVGDTLTFDRVMLVSDDKKTTIGTPLVAKAAVKAKIVGQLRGEKISVRRFKSKVRYRKATGFREHLTKLEILSIS